MSQPSSSVPNSLENLSALTRDAASDDGGINLSGIIHALRRRWMSSLVFGVPLALIVAALLWLLIPERYEAVAELLVRSQEDRLLPALDNRVRGPYVASDYDIFRQTQASLITSAFVLNAVLRNEEILSLSMLDPDEEPNPVGYLQDNLRATYPNDAEVLQISMRGDHPDELKKLVDAVTDAYLEETVSNRRTRLDDRKRRLEKEYAENRDEIRRKRESIHNQEVQLGARDSSNAYIRHQLELENLRKLAAARDTIQSRLYEIDLRLALASAIEQNVGDVELPEYLITEELERDDTYNRLLQELDTAQQFYTSIAATARPTAPSVQRAAEQTAMLNGQLAARRRQLSHRVEQKILNASVETGDNEASAPLLEAERAILVKRHGETKKQHDDQLAYVRQLDGFSARLETEREELNYAVKLNQARNAEIEDLKVQLDSPDRIVKIQSATIPNSNSRQAKLIQVVCAAIVALGMVSLGFVTWDVTRKFVNSPQEAAAAYGAPVLGKLPELHNRSPWLHSASRGMEASLIESIDGIRTSITRPPNDARSPLAIMVTSSVDGEGRTTLATYLAAACARTGKRVLLIDADTQNPQQHIVFEQPGGRGLCDMLRANSSSESLVVRTAYDNLDLLPAGLADAASRREMTSEELPGFLRDLSQNYDFVIIDTGPALTSIEPLVFGRCVDVILVSTKRDVSTESQLQDARDRLLAVGVDPTGVVFQGGRVVHRQAVSQLEPSQENSEVP